MKSNAKLAYDNEYFDKLDELSWKRRRRALGRFERQFLELLQANSDDIVLDAGCGTGWHIFNYGSRCKYVVGVDISKAGLRRTAELLRQHRRNGNVRLICADGQKLPLRARSFSKILCISLIEHLADPTQFVSEAWRVLEKGGLIIIATPNKIDPILRTLEFVARKTRRRMPLIGHADDTHQQLFTLNSLKNLLKACGFRISKIKVHHSPLGMKTFGGDLVVSAVKTIGTGK